jgi:hypothetical protein
MNPAAPPVNPQRPFWELSARMPDNAVLTCDSGSVASWYALDIKAKPGMLGRSRRETPRPMRCGVRWSCRGPTDASLRRDRVPSHRPDSAKFRWQLVTTLLAASVA